MIVARRAGDGSRSTRGVICVVGDALPKNIFVPETRTRTPQISAILLKTVVLWLQHFHSFRQRVSVSKPTPRAA